jgi:hypothetical protein
MKPGSPQQFADPSLTGYERRSEDLAGVETPISRREHK